MESFEERKKKEETGKASEENDEIEALEKDLNSIPIKQTPVLPDTIDSVAAQEIPFDDEFNEQKPKETPKEKDLQELGVLSEQVPAKKPPLQKEPLVEEGSPTLESVSEQEDLVEEESPTLESEPEKDKEEEKFRVLPQSLVNQIRKQNAQKTETTQVKDSRNVSQSEVKPLTMNLDGKQVRIVPIKADQNQRNAENIRSIPASEISQPTSRSSSPKVSKKSQSSKKEAEKESWTALLKRKAKHWKSEWQEKKEVLKEKWEEFERSLAESKEGKQVRSGKIKNRKIPLIQCSNCLHHVGEQISRYLALDNEAICEYCGVELVEENQIKTENYVYLYKDSSETTHQKKE